MRRYRGSDHSVLAIVTIGVDILLTTELTRRIGTDVLPLGDPWGDAVLTVGPVSLAHTRIAAFVAAALLITAFLLAFRYTSWGVAMRAAAEKPGDRRTHGRTARAGVARRLGGRRWLSPRSPPCSSPSSRPRAWSGPRRSPR